MEKQWDMWILSKSDVDNANIDKHKLDDDDYEDIAEDMEKAICAMIGDNWDEVLTGIIEDTVERKPENLKRDIKLLETDLTHDIDKEHKEERLAILKSKKEKLKEIEGSL